MNAMRGDTRRPHRRMLAALTALLMLLAACGGTDEDADPAPDSEESEDSGDAGEDDAGDAGSELSDEVAAAAAAAEELGMIFFTSRDEIVELANENGPLTAFISSDQADMAAANFSEDTGIEASVEDFSGTDAYTRWLLEAESGALSGLDIQQNPPEVYSEFAEFSMPYDILGMAEAGILDIPVEMIDPERRNLVAVGSQIAGYAWNPNLIDQEVIPTTWEGFCDTSFLEGEPFMLDLRPSNVAPLVEVLGMDAVLEIMDCVVANDPILTRGTTDALTRVTAGEVPLHIFTNYHSALRAASEAQGNLDAALIEPVPIRLSNVLGVLNEDISSNPYAGLLFIEWMAGARGQEVLDADPLKSSVFAEDSEIARAVEGLEISGGSFETYLKLEDDMETIAQEIGLPSE
jgi:ABC-type Fe3+ transport system substrate-binding protein